MKNIFATSLRLKLYFWPIPSKRCTKCMPFFFSHTGPKRKHNHKEALKSSLFHFQTQDTTFLLFSFFFFFFVHVLFLYKAAAGFLRWKTLVWQSSKNYRTLKVTCIAELFILHFISNMEGMIKRVWAEGEAKRCLVLK